MKLLRNIVVGVVGLVIVAFLVGFLLPREVHVERTVMIDAPQERVFALVNDYNEWDKWSPWADIDPDAEMVIEGEPGVGQKMAWSSEDPKVGVGEQSITTSEPFGLVENELDFGDMGVAKAYFEIEPSNGGSLVTWGFDTDMGGNPVGRYFGLMMDGMVGKDYERGLERLKEVAETGA